MNAIIDTNILYYLCGESKCNIDPNKLLINLKQMESYAVSELAILEMYNHFINDKNKIREIINFLVSNQIPANKVLPQKYAFVDKDIFKVINNNDVFNILVNSSTEKKKEIENKYLRFWILSIATIYSTLQLTNNNNFDNFNLKQYIENYFELFSLMVSENSNLYSELKNALDNFYQDEVESKFKNTIQEIVINICMIISISVKLEQYGYDSKKIIIDFNTYGNDKKSLIVKILDDEYFIKRLNKKRNKPISLINKVMKDDMYNNLQKYENSLSNFATIGEIKYLKILFKKIFLDNKKINKNDIFDSLYFKYYYPKSYIITYDQSMLKAMEEIDLDYYNVVKKTIDQSIYSI